MHLSPKQEVTGDQRKVRDEEVYRLYQLLNITKVIKSRRMMLERIREGKRGEIFIRFWGEN
jgi:hypothetical protein